MIENFPSMRFRFERKGDHLLLWYTFDAHEETGPFALTESDTTDLVALFEAAAEIVRTADARNVSTSSTASPTSRRTPTLTDPFALRSPRDADDTEDDS